MTNAKWGSVVIVGWLTAGGMAACASGEADVDTNDDGGTTTGPGTGGRGGSMQSTGGDATGGDATGGDATGGSATGGDATGAGAPGGSGGDPGPDCGNGVIDVGEQCDGVELNGQTCANFFHAAGEVVCNTNCMFDSSDCHTCGNGNLEGAEVCDGANHDMETCVTLMHDGGTLACAGDCMAFDEAACSDCGDGVVEDPEECDLSNLDGQTCITRGYGGGTLSCDGTCSFVETACAFYQCSDATDNDGDGFTDLTDPGCTSADDNDEGIFSDTCGGIGGPVYDITFADTTQDIVITGTTAGGVNNFTPPAQGDCFGATGPEVVLFYRVFNQMNVEFTFDPFVTTFDTVLYIHQTNCGAPTASACNDDYWAPPDLTSRLFVTLPPGDYYIFVDGWGGQSGNFELLLDLP